MCVSNYLTLQRLLEALAKFDKAFVQRIIIASIGQLRHRHGRGALVSTGTCIWRGACVRRRPWIDCSVVIRKPGSVNSIIGQPGPWTCCSFHELISLCSDGDNIPKATRLMLGLISPSAHTRTHTHTVCRSTFSKAKRA